MTVTPTELGTFIFTFQYGWISNNQRQEWKAKRLCHLHSSMGGFLTAYKYYKLGHVKLNLHSSMGGFLTSKSELYCAILQAFTFQYGWISNKQLTLSMKIFQLKFTFQYGWISNWSMLVGTTMSSPYLHSSMGGFLTNCRQGSHQLKVIFTFQNVWISNFSVSGSLAKSPKFTFQYGWISNRQRVLCADRWRRKFTFQYGWISNLIS